MKQITRQLFAAAIIVIACSLNAGCSKKENLKEDSELHVAEKLFSQEEKQAYMTQMSLVSSTEEERKTDHTVYNLFEKANDDAVDWTYFDKLYNDSLSNPAKQEIGFTILCKKDLIGMVNKQPENVELVAALKKYVDILVETNYIGYTSLYYALQTLKPIDEAYVKEKAAAILTYAKKDTFHTTYINDKENMAVNKKSYDKFVENFKYASRITTLL